MVWVFWIGLAAIIVIDFFLAFKNKVKNSLDTFSGKAARLGESVPTVPYFAGAMASHFWASIGTPVPIGWGWAIMLGVGFLTAIWHNWLDWPLPPFVALILGLGAGVLIPV